MIRAAFLLALALVCSSFAAHARGAATLVKDGKPVAAIVLPAQTEYERFAAQEPQRFAALLRRHSPDMPQASLDQRIRQHVAAIATIGDEEVLAAEELRDAVETISGARLEIVRAGADGQPPEAAAILLGAELARAAVLGAKLDGLDRDGILLVAQGDDLVLSGRRARGTLYAAYDFLESLGCRWVMPGAFGQIYPALTTISTGIDKTQNPSHAQRYFWCTYGNTPEYARWTLRNKGNFVLGIGDQRVAQGHALAQPLRWAAGQPVYQVKATVQVGEKRTGEDGQESVEPVEKEVAALPDEFYAMRDGKLDKNVPHFANPKVWDLYAQYYIDFFNNAPEVDYVSISAEDGWVSDERPESRKLRSNDYDSFIGAMSSTDQLWFFHNRVIEKVVKVHPDKKFGVLVYSNNMTPPRVEAVHPNMALVFAPLTISPLTPVGDPKEKTNLAYGQWLEAWMGLAKAAGAETYYYDYEPLGYCWNTAMICPRWGIIGKNYPYFHKLGLDGHTTQGFDDWAACGLDNYLMQRLYWDASQPYQEVIADYSRARFGKAAPALIEYYARLERALADAPDLYSNETWANHLILTPQVRKEARALLERAVALAASEGERVKAHVQNAVDLQAMTDAMCDGIEHAADTGDFGASARIMDSALRIAEKLNAIYPHFVHPARIDRDSNAQFLTGGQYKQFLGFDRRIKAAAASLVLPRSWKGCLDTDERAGVEGLYKPEVSVEVLEDQDTTVCPDVKHRTQREAAAFFYRTDVDVPESFAGKKATLYFPSVIAKSMQIWVNGQPIEFDQGAYRDTTWRGPDYFWIDYNHEQNFDVTPQLRPGQKNTIAVRVFKSFDFGGTYRRVWLLAE